MSCDNSDNEENVSFTHSRTDKTKLWIGKYSLRIYRWRYLRIGPLGIRFRQAFNFFCIRLQIYSNSSENHRIKNLVWGKGRHGFAGNSNFRKRLVRIRPLAPPRRTWPVSPSRPSAEALGMARHGVIVCNKCDWRTHTLVIPTYIIILLKWKYMDGKHYPERNNDGDTLLKHNNITMKK